MSSNIKKMDSGGFTLVELIASIAILGMVIAVLIPFFPQIMSWNKNIDNDLVASNLLGQVAQDIKEDPGIYITNTLDTPYELDENYQLNGVNYFPVITLYQKDEDNKLGLYRTRIQIYDANNNLLSETYIYLTNEGDTNE